MSTWSRGARSATLAGVVCLASLHAGAAAASSSPCARGWGIVPSPTPPGGSALAVDVASFSDGTAWAVGFINPVFRPSTMALHDDGSGWTMVPTPNPDPVSNRLDGVAGVAGDDVWAVGSRQSGEDGTLVEHWNGTTWSVVPSPNSPQPFNSLDAVSADSPTDAWAVGSTQDASGSKESTLVEHWDGSDWTIVASPSPGRINNLFGVSARSSTDAWAVGSFSTVSRNHTLVLHWDGTAWTPIDAPSPGLADNALFSANSLGLDDAWAVGYAADGTQESDKVPVTLHWNGTAWALIPNPPLAAQLDGVAAGPGGDVWAAGYLETPMTTLIERWDGSEWRRVRSEDPTGAFASFLVAIAVGPGPDSAWAVGSAEPTAGIYRTLVEHPCAP